MSLFLYNIFVVLYGFAIRIAAMVNPKARLWMIGRKSIFTQLQKSFGPNASPIVWMHCASLGEFEQGRPLLESFKKNYPGYKVLLTFFSPSGYEIQKKFPGADYIFYLPIDSKKNAQQFLQIVKPALVLWVKYDYWYYYLSALKKNNIPTLLIAASFRKKQPFFTWYGSLHRYMLSCFTHLFVQTSESALLLQSIGIVNNLTICGDTRFDRVFQIAREFEPISIIEVFCGQQPVIVAGSTWLEDEEELDHYANTHPEIKFIIAPHDIEEARLKELESLFHNAVRYSTINGAQSKAGNPASWTEISLPSFIENKNVLIVDNIGMLSRIYKYATVTYIGGGFGNDGVHNVLEAAVYGKPVVFGPVYEKYIEAMDLIEKGAAYSIESALEFEELLDKMLADKDWLLESGKSASEYVCGKTGATKNILMYIQVNRLLIN